MIKKKKKKMAFLFNQTSCVDVSLLVSFCVLSTNRNYNDQNNKNIK